MKLGINKNGFKVSKKEASGENGEGVNDFNPINFNINPKVLDFPVCSKPLQSQMSQCVNGHIACSYCCKKLQNQCPKCELSMDIRCPMLESIIESIKVPCTYARLGCNKSISYIRKEIHEACCPSAPCTCPFLDCMFRSSSHQFIAHTRSEHPFSGPESVSYDFCTSDVLFLTIEQHKPFRVLYWEDKLFLLLNGWNILSGNLLSLVCISAAFSDREFQYGLNVGFDKNESLQFNSSMQIMREWKRDYPAKSLFVHDELIRSMGGSIYVDFSISKTFL